LDGVAQKKGSQRLRRPDVRRGSASPQAFKNNWGGPSFGLWLKPGQSPDRGRSPVL